MSLNNVSPKMIKGKEFAHFHVFTDSNDFHFEIKDSYTEAYIQAFKCRDELVNNGNRNIRVYYVNETKDHRDGEIIQLEETCLYSLGDYPS